MQKSERFHGLLWWGFFLSLVSCTLPRNLVHFAFNTMRYAYNQYSHTKIIIVYWHNRRGMRDFRSSRLLAPVGSGFLQYSRNNHLQIMKKLQNFFSHPCGILCDLSIDKWDNIRNMRERYVVSAPGNSLYVSCVFRCSPQQNSTYVL